MVNNIDLKKILKIKSPSQTVIKMAAPYLPNTCEQCGSLINYGCFAYRKTLCWNCFEKVAIKAAKEADTFQETDVILHLLQCGKIHYKNKIGEGLIL